MDGLEEFGEPFDLYSYFWACGHLGVVKYRGQERYSFLRFSKENLHLKRLGITLLQAKEESWKSTHGYYFMWNHLSIQCLCTVTEPDLLTVT